MPQKQHIFKKFCNGCGKLFRPNSRGGRYCDRCKIKIEKKRQEKCRVIGKLNRRK